MFQGNIFTLSLSQEINMEIVFGTTHGELSYLYCKKKKKKKNCFTVDFFFISGNQFRNSRPLIEIFDCLFTKKINNYNRHA